jgi:hypothetical protein
MKKNESCENLNVGIWNDSNDLNYFWHFLCFFFIFIKRTWVSKNIMISFFFFKI